MRNFLRIMVAVAIAVMSIASIGNVAVAATGSITGYVHADNGTALQSAHVVAYDWETGVTVGEDLTDASGAYSITGLPSGSYKVRADATRYLPEYYNEGTATPVSVTDPNATPDINFTLTPGSSISGHVYQDDGTTPIEVAHVVAYDNVTWTEVGDAYASADGSYSITTGTGSGSYFVRARLDGWAAEYYDNVSTQGAATQVAVTALTDTPNIDFTLTQIGYISGYVYGADGVTPLTTATVTAYDNTTGAYVYKGSAGASDGYYYINLAPGTYRILAYTDPPEYVPQWSDNVQVATEDPADRNDFWSGAAEITIVGLENSSGHNFSMLPVQAVSTDAASSLTTTSATLNGNLDSMGASTSDNVSFEWGTTTSYGNTTAPEAKTATGAFNAPLSGLSPNATYHFRAIAEGYVTSYGDDATFTTSTAAPSVNTSAATSLAATSATLNGDLTSKGTASTVNVSFEWGLTTSYGTTTTPEAKTATGTFSANLTGLTAKTTYHFRAKAVGDGTTYGGDATFTTSTIAPTVTTNAASSVATTSATLNGNLTALGTATSDNVSFEWGLTTSYGSVTTPEAKTATGAFTANLTGLTAKTTYHFRAKAVGDGTTYGDDLTLTTSTVVPTVTTSAATSLAATTATLNGNLAALGTATSVSVSFEWGTTTSYGSTTTAEAKTATGTFSANLTGLTGKTTYHFRTKAVGDGSAVYGDDMTFTTIDATAPVISAVTSTDITKTGATITWTTDEGATSQVEYGLTEEYGSATTLDANAVTSHSVALTGLKAGKTYHYRAISKDAANNQAVSADGTFKTTASSGGMPVWAWVIIGLAVVGVVGGTAYFVRGRLAER